MAMNKVFCVLACLLCAVQGRRIQNEKTANLVADPQPSSLAQVQAGLSPRNTVNLNPHATAHAVPQSQRVSAPNDGTAVPHVAPAVKPQAHMTPQKEPVRSSEVHMSASSALPNFEQAKAEPTIEVESTQQPWYGNLHTNAAVLLGATVCSRVALRFRNRVSRASDVSMNAETATPGASDVTRASDVKMNAASGFDFSLFICVALWYLGNYYYNITNKLALNAAGGAAGTPLAIATLQLGVGAIYAIFLWLAPDARERPKITMADYKASLPVAAAAAASHAATVFSIGAGAVSFAQIVKASEPFFAALVGTLFYSQKVSTAKWLSLIPVIGGVCLASLGEMGFAVAALVAGLIANVTAAIKGNENSKLMGSAGIADRFVSVGNIFAVTIINMFLFLIPVVLIAEGPKLGAFFATLKTSSVLKFNLIASGLWFFLYNELATLVVKKTNAVTQSVLNTAKRVIVIVVVALVLGESLGAIKLIGCGIGIGGVFLYSIIDKLVGSKK